MEIYKTRLIKTIYNVYSIKSDIEGATVIFDGEEVGTIQNGSFTYQLPQKTDLADSHTISIKENTGTLYQKPIDYILSTVYTEEDRYPVSNLQNSITLEVEGEGNITSVKTSYTQSYPSQVVVENISQDIELNTVQTPSSELVGITGNLLNVPANHTTNPIQGEIEITQDESGNKMSFPYEQAAGVQTSFTVNSDIEGATVTISNGNTISKQGTISQGSCQILFWQDEWEEGSMTAQVSGDNSLLKPEEETYTFSNNTEDPVVFQGVGGDFLIEDYWTIISTYGNTTYSYPSLSSIGLSHSITLNQIPYSETGQQIEYSPTELNLPPTTSEVNSSITITQNGSNKTLSLPYRQLSMSLHTYTVFSDIEGARVQFGDLGTGIVSNGRASISVWDNKVQDSVLVTITGGTLVTKETEYVFEQTDTIPTVSASGGTANFNSYIESSKTVYTSNYPSSESLAKDSSITLNTVITNKTEDVSFTPNGHGFQGNETTSVRTESVLISQSESGKTLNIQVTQAAGISYTYTVSSNIEGATVNFSNGGKGIINNGSCILTLWNDKAPSSLTFTLSGGTVSSPGAWEYEFDITTLGGTSLGSSDTYNASGEGASNLATGGTSRKRRIEYSVPTSTFTVARNGSRTANQVGNYTSYTTLSYSITSVSQSWISHNSSNQITLSRNSTSSTRTGTITYTQAESNKTDIITISQARGTYTYTINSNCNGGTVYFGTSSSSQTSNVGTISNGKCVFKRTEASGYVRISGGVPSNTSSVVDRGTQSGRETTTDKRTGTEGNVEFSSKTGVSGTDSEVKTISHAYTADSDTVDIICTERDWTQTRTGSRTRYRDYTTTRYYTYSNPSVKAINGDSSITMNYTENYEDDTSYGDWYSNEDWSWGSYGNAVYGSYRRGNCNCIGFSYDGGNFTASATRGSTIGSGSTAGYRFTVKTTENTGGAGRAWGDFGDGSNWCRVMINKAAKPDNYVFRLTANGGTTAQWNFPSGESGAEFQFRVESTKNGSYQTFKNTRNTVSWISVSYADQSSASIIVKLRCTSANTGAAGRGGALDFTQDGSGKKISITMNQPVANKSELYFYSNSSAALTLSWSPASTVGTKNNFCTVISKDKNGNNVKPTAYVKTGSASVTVGNLSSGRYPINVTIKDAYTGNQSYDIVIQNSAGKTANLHINRY